MLIESPANPIVKALRSLESPKGRQARRLFLVEGVRAVEEGLRAGYWPEVCLYNVELLARTERGGELLRGLWAKDGRRGEGAEVIEAWVREIEEVRDSQPPRGGVTGVSVMC